MSVIDISTDYDEVIQQMRYYYITGCYERAEEKKSPLKSKEKDSENTSLVIQERDTPKIKKYTIEKERSLCNPYPQLILKKIDASAIQKNVGANLTARRPQGFSNESSSTEKHLQGFSNESSSTEKNPQRKPRKGIPKKSNQSLRHDHCGFSNESSSTEQNLQRKPKRGRPKISKESLRLGHWNIRRSERIQMKLIEKECNLAASCDTCEPTLEKTNTSQRKKRTSSKGKQKSLKTGAQSSSVGPTTLSSNAMPYVKVPERVEGLVNRGGDEYVIVKWKDQKYPEHISTKNLSGDLKRLVVSYLHSRLLMLTPTKNASQEKEDHLSLVRENSTCHEREEHAPVVREDPVCQERGVLIVSEDPVCQEREEHVPIVRGDLCQEREENTFLEIRQDGCSTSQADMLVTLNCTVTNNINTPLPSHLLQQISISNYKNQQQLLFKENSLFDKESAHTMDVKLAI